jgi:small subunit ribosomal protein S2
MTAARLFLRRGAFLPVQDRKLTLTACHAAPAPALAPSRRFISLSSIKVQVPPEHKDKTLVNPTYHPQGLISHPPALQDVTLELLLASQCHLGHSTTLWHPANARYIFGIRDGIHIISLEQTAAHLRRAAKVVRQVAERAGVILFANTRRGHEQSVVKAARLSNGYHLIDKWIPGALTNGERILGHCTLKVVDQEDREIEGFEEQLDEITTMKPDLVVCLNPTDNFVLLHECALFNIPTIGIVDTNANPTWVTYPIPANDDRYDADNPKSYG